MEFPQDFLLVILTGVVLVWILDPLGLATDSLSRPLMVPRKS